MSRRSTSLLAVAVFAFLVAASIARATRPEPEAAEAGKSNSPDKTETSDEALDECEKAGGSQEDCMARRTLAAHTDYIYTQEHHR